MGGMSEQQKIIWASPASHPFGDSCSFKNLWRSSKKVSALINSFHPNHGILAEEGWPLLGTLSFFLESLAGNWHRLYFWLGSSPTINTHTQLDHRQLHLTVFGAKKHTCCFFKSRFNFVRPTTYAAWTKMLVFVHDPSCICPSPKPPKLRSVIIWHQREIGGKKHFFKTCVSQLRTHKNSHGFLTKINKLRDVSKVHSFWDTLLCIEKSISKFTTLHPLVLNPGKLSVHNSLQTMHMYQHKPPNKKM